MAVTLKWNESLNDIDVLSGGLKLLEGPQATRQNIIMAQRTVRGTWPGNINTVGFPVNSFLTAGMLLEGNGDTQGVSALVPIIRDFLRSQDGSTGITGVIRVLSSPDIEIRPETQTLHYTVTVLDETSQPISMDGSIDLSGQEAL